MLTTNEKKNIWVLYKAKGMTKTDIAKHLKISRNTVIKTLNEQEPEIEQIVNVVKNAEQKSNEELIEILKTDTRFTDIVNKVLNTINNDELIERYANENGLKSLMTVVGILSDKNIKAHSLELDKRKVTAIEKSLELKERELNMRLENPEAFSGVTIINDADEVSTMIKEMNLLKNHNDNYSN